MDVALLVGLPFLEDSVGAPPQAAVRSEANTGAGTTSRLSRLERFLGRPSESATLFMVDFLPSVATVLWWSSLTRDSASIASRGEEVPRNFREATWTARRARSTLERIKGGYMSDPTWRPRLVGGDRELSIHGDAPIETASVGDRAAVPSGQRDSRMTAVLPRSLPDELTNLPRQLTSFVGRGAEIMEVKSLLSQARLVTLTGTGGVGKTRLALEVASQVVDQFADGVWLVELASIADPDLLPEVVMSALGLRAQPGQSAIESLITFMSSRSLLLVLDNCEHLVEGCAVLVAALLASRGEIRILATSRDVLRVAGETIWRVPSMPTPSTEAASLNEVRDSEAVQLFANRAGASAPGFGLGDDNAAVVAQICQWVDGIPLAIELAAARIRMMPPTVIVELLEDRISLLTGGSRAAPHRQQTLRATLDWSYDLLTDDEKSLFARLSVFVGGFTVKAAQAVCWEAESEPAPRSVISTLTSLIDKSLVTCEEGADKAGRYRLLETVRQYASARLVDAGAADNVQRRHAEFYLEYGDVVSRELRGPEQPTWLARIDDDIGNLRLAFAWTLSKSPRGALRLAVALRRYWFTGSRAAEAREWLTRALEANPDRDELRCRGLCDASWWALCLAHVDEGRRLAHEALTLAKGLNDPLGTGRALNALAIAEIFEGRSGSYERAISFLFEAEPPLREANDHEALALMLNDRGVSHQSIGDVVRARAEIEEGLAFARHAGDAELMGMLLDGLAGIEFDAGEPAAAEAHWYEALGHARECRSPWAASAVLIGLARVAIANAAPERSLRLLAASAELTRRTGMITEPTSRDVVAKVHREAVDFLGDAAAGVVWQEGTRMSLVEAIRYGLSDQMGSESVARADRAENRLVREGDFWSVTYAGVVVRLRDSKGLRDIARLLAMPGREVAAVDLVGGEHRNAAGRVETATVLGLGVEGDAGEALDSRARSEYRARLADLEEEVADAEVANDPERATRARRERDFLLAELGAAVGLGGHPRRALDPAERRRKAVTWRIRDAINHIEAVHPRLGQHLRRSLRTGRFCVYKPPETTSWQLR